MSLIKRNKLLFVIQLVIIVGFSMVFIVTGNMEFLIYIAVILVSFGLLIGTDRYVNYSHVVVWGLALWSWMHMAGGGIWVGDGRIYDVILWDLVGDPYFIFKYDQLVHLIGFGVTTFLVHDLISKDGERLPRLLFVSFLGGLGFGALNEILEFFVTVITPSTGVGGYFNTSLDLVFNMVGALLAVVILYIIHVKK